jgi:hypothetical protein
MSIGEIQNTIGIEAFIILLNSIIWQTCKRPVGGIEGFMVET